MKEIRGEAKNLRALLASAKFAIDYYQREYRWETKQVAELIDDLTEKFGDSHDPGNDRTAVEQYGHYFLGSIRFRSGLAFACETSPHRHESK